MTNHSENNTPASSHHGSVSSYVTGFILSILLTIIPYFMVKNQVAGSTALLIAVLGLAIVQMFVQMFFFLHLGRGPKPFYNIVFFAATSGMIVLVVGASILIMNNLYSHMSPEEITLRLAQDENIAAIGDKKTGACQGNRANHEILVGDLANMPYIEANRCDTLTFKSGDNVAHELQFGTYDEPASYGGLEGIFVRTDRAKIITLNETGTFSYHDRNDPTVVGSFSVIEP